MARLYANENFPRRAVEALRALGHDVLTTQESGNAGQGIPDEDVLTFATTQQRIVITFNRKHFIKLHQQNSHHAGVIVCTVDADIQAFAARIDKALADNPQMAGLLVRVIRPNV